MRNKVTERLLFMGSAKKIVSHMRLASHEKPSRRVLEEMVIHSGWFKRLVVEPLSQTWTIGDI